MDRRVVLPALFAGVALVVASGAKSEDDTLVGTYTLAADASREIDAAIDASVAQMSFIIRPMARSRLRQNNMAYERIRIAKTDTGIEIALGDLAPIDMPANGAPVRSTSEGG